MNTHTHIHSLIFVIISVFIMACNPSGVKLLSSKDHTASVLEFQNKLNTGFASEESPLSAEDKKDFKQLDFFPIDKKYQVLAHFKRTPEERPFAMPTSSEKTPIYVKYGEVSFQLKGEPFTLSLYRSSKLSRIPEYKYYLFLPFTDLTNGDSTYGGGRYIDLQIPKGNGNKIIIDFNKAYNPLCAYSDGFSCPIPPKENFLDAEIRAGVKAWEKEQ